MKQARQQFLVLLAGAVIAAAAGLSTPLAHAAAATGASRPAASAAAEDVTLYFLRGEQFARIGRETAGRTELDAAVRALVAGPTSDERRRGIRSRIPAGTRLHGTSLAGGVATIDLSEEFRRGSEQSLRVRLAQLVYTATRVPRVDAVRITIDGVALTRLGDTALSAPLSRAAFAPTPQGGPPEAAPPGARSPLVAEIQRKLISLRYLPPGAADGIAGPQTRHAILAFQGWEALPRDGRATSRLNRQLAQSTAPIAAPGPARRIDVSLSRQVALLIRSGRVIRTIHVSTGKPSSPTPPGRFRVFRKELMSWSVPFSVWLPYASYFNRGIAFHESADVPAFPASAGCVRVPAAESRRVYRFASFGTVVIVRRS